VKRVLVVAALALSVLAARVDAAPAATSECRGFLTCVPVAGPWVVVPPSRATPRPSVQYQLTCPKGFVVGGLDAELSDRAIDVWFFGASGSPVAPGRTTSRTIVFVATYVGSGARAPTFRPHAGCIPGGGGGSRTPTAFSAVFPPGKPTVRRVRTIRVQGSRSYAVRCRSDERLVAAYTSRGFRTAKPPTPGLVDTLSASSAVTPTRISVSVKGGSGRGVVQIAAVCAGGK
jgi:hypothetical protein